MAATRKPTDVGTFLEDSETPTPWIGNDMLSTVPAAGVQIGRKEDLADNGLGEGIKSIVESFVGDKTNSFSSVMGAPKVPSGYKMPLVGKGVR